MYEMQEARRRAEDGGDHNLSRLAVAQSLFIPSIIQSPAQHLLSLTSYSMITPPQIASFCDLSVHHLSFSPCIPPLLSPSSPRQCFCPMPTRRKPQHLDLDHLRFSHPPSLLIPLPIPSTVHPKPKTNHFIPSLPIFPPPRDLLALLACYLPRQRIPYTSVHPPHSLVLYCTTINTCSRRGAAAPTNFTTLTSFARLSSLSTNTAEFTPPANPLTSLYYMDPIPVLFTTYTNL